jgi:uncharacterized membrane protein (DUF4010 family)
MPFLLTLAVSFLIGMGLREYYEHEGKFETFGTTRTFVFIGLLGFVLYLLPEIGHAAFLAGFGALALFLIVYYANKLEQKKGPGLIGVLVALLTYGIGPIALTRPAGYAVLIAISTLLVVHSKGRIRRLSDRLETGEIVTLCKFLAIAGVILPLIPAAPVLDGGWLARLVAALPVTPRQVWLAVVITTGISYFGYVLQTYLVPKRGLLLTGVIGGIYSSTAAVLVLARRSRAAPDRADESAAAILLAVSMMYLRVLALVAIFRLSASAGVAPALLGLAGLAAGYALWLHRRAAPRVPAPAGDKPAVPEAALRKNPLELNAAIVFAILYAVTALATKYILDAYRETGLRLLSFVVGFSDITPFVVSVLQGNLGLGDRQIVQAVVIATAGNNLLKTAYTYMAGARRTAALVAPGLAGLALLSILSAFLGL